MRYLVLLILMLVTAPASAQSSWCSGANCGNSLGNTMTPAKSKPAEPIFYEGRRLCPFYCTKTWVCDFVPCEEPAAKPKVKR